MNFLFSFSFVKIVVPAILIFIVLDLIWLALAARSLYFADLGYLAVIKDGKIVFRLGFGLFAQVVIAAGLTLFILLSLKVNPSLSNSILTGAILGFVIYATYDLTNISFIKDWPIRITIIDICWGTLQGLLAGIYVFYLAKFFKSV